MTFGELDMDCKVIFGELDIDGFIPQEGFSFIADLVCGRDCEEGWNIDWFVVEGF